MIQKILITPGETNGVGLEVTLKALTKIKNGSLYRDKAFVFLSSSKVLQDHLNLLNISRSSFKTCTSFSDNLTPGVYYIDSTTTPFSWFAEAVDFCSTHPSQAAVVTGPLRKSSFDKALGHTDYLRQRFTNTPCFMTFFGDHYNSLLLSDHIPIESVSDLDFKRLLGQALNVLKKFPNQKKIALLGLNPHAGEGGLIGSIDENVHKDFARKHSELIEGPLPADSFFSIESYQKYSFLIANYHDQALIPFKLIHGFDGAQASLGLPFVRTSVDHGTGDDLYLKNKANPKSMLRAIDLAVDLLNPNQERINAM